MKRLYVSSDTSLIRSLSRENNPFTTTLAVEVKRTGAGGGDKSRLCGCFLQANGAECKSVEIVPALLVDRHQELKVHPQQVVAKLSELAHRDKVAKPGG